MCSASISKRTFFKSLGCLAILGMIAPWFKRASVNSAEELPMEVHKEPNAVARANNLL